MQDKDKKAIKAIIDDFFKNATEKELLELQSLLEDRKRKGSLGNLNLQNTASSFAENLRRQMGLTSKQIKKNARDAVRTMILQYDPNIPEEQITILLNMWVPDQWSNWRRIPVDITRAMISQFVEYGRGELTKEQLKDFPNGWAKKYWTFFPEEVQRLIEAYIRDRISKSFFWESIEEILSKG